MAVTGVFTADFSSFDKAVTQSAKNLDTLDAGTEKVNSSLRLMTQTQEQMLDKIGASGGRIQDVGKSAEQSGGQVNSLTESYKQFDGMLQAAGINIGPQVKGLEDLANMAGKTATELGAIGTAGAIAGAALTGWKIGSLIADVTNLDEAFGNLLSNLAGWGDIMTDADRRQSVMNQATDLGARNIHGYADAVKFLHEQTQKNIDANINWSDKLIATRAEVDHLTERQKIQIEVAQMAGATTEQITNKFGISAQALKILADEQKNAADKTAEHNREIEKQNALLHENRFDPAKTLSGFIAATEVAAQKQKDINKVAGEDWNKVVAGHVAAAEEMQASEKKLAEAAAASTFALEQESLTAANDAMWMGQMAEAHTEAGAAATAGTAQTVQGYQQVAQQVQITSDGVKGWLELMRATNAANALLNQNSLFTSSSTLENQARLGGAFSPIPGFASGIENFGGGLAKVHGGEVLANLPAGTSVFPKGSGFGATISNVFNLVDSESNLARRVSELIMRQVRAGTQLGTA